MGFDLGDLTDVEPSTGSGSFTLLPKGIYRLGINDTSDEEAPNEGDSSYAYIEYAVAEGAYEGSTFRVFYTLKNANPEAVHISRRDLAALGLAVGVPGGNSELLIGKTFMAKVGIKPASVNKRTGKQYGESNKIDKYYAPNEQVPDLPPIAATVAPTPLRQTPIVASPSTARSTFNGGAASAVVAGARSAPWQARRPAAASGNDIPFLGSA